MKVSASALLALAVVAGAGYFIYSQKQAAVVAPPPQTAQLTAGTGAKPGGRQERRQAVTAGVLGAVGGALQGVLASGALS